MLAYFSLFFWKGHHSRVGNKNMVGAEAEWLYNLEEWDAIFDMETRKALYKEQKSSTTIVKEAKIYPNDPCPCGSGKKYKKCCGKK